MSAEERKNGWLLKGKSCSVENIKIANDVYVFKF